jgi:hypothetical protein
MQAAPSPPSLADTVPETNQNPQPESICETPCGAVSVSHGMDGDHLEDGPQSPNIRFLGNTRGVPYDFIAEDHVPAIRPITGQNVHSQLASARFLLDY